MAAQLGETRDPRELIPGNSEDLNDRADKLRARSKTLEGIGDDLGAVRIPSWEGKASDAFWKDFSPQKARWHRGSDSMAEAERALRDYARTLTWAQSQAERAIQQHESGDEAGAETTLNSARTQLETAGDTAAKKFEAQGGKADGAPDWLFFSAEAADSDTGNTSMQIANREMNPLTNRRAWGDFKNLTSEQRQALREEISGKGPGIAVAGPSVSGGASVWGAEAQGRSDFAGGEVSGKAGVNLLGVEGQAGVGLQDGNATASASGKAYLAQASAEGKYEAGYFETSGKASAFAGAQAEAKGSVGTDGAHGEAGAFAGAKAEAEGHAGVAGVGVGGTAEGWAGAGAEAKFDAGFKDDGTFVVGGEAGVGLGLGGKLGGQIEIDPGKVTDAAGDAADAVGDWGGSAKDTVGGWFD
jgi:type VII secretion system ESX-1 substrate